MRSLQFIGSKSLGGAERWFIRFSQALESRGVEVRAMVRRHSELDGEVTGALPVTPVAARTVWDPLSRWEVTRLIHDYKPDIVQTYMGRATRLTHVPRSSETIHVSRLGGYYDLAGYRHADAWVGNTKGICDYLIRGGMPAKQVFHISNFAEPVDRADQAQLQDLRRQLELSEEDLILMAPGRFVDFKGHRFLLAALERLPETIADRRVRLLMLGKGPLEADLHQQAREAGIEHRIIWAGWQVNPAPWYQIADMIVFPSRQREPLGNVILESWAYEKPLVTTDYWGAVEISTHGSDVWRVPCDDPDKLAAAIVRVGEDEALQQSLVEGGRNTLSNRFSESTIMNQYEELYRHLLANRRG